MKIRTLCILVILALNGCIVNPKENNEKSLYGTWRLYDIEQQNKNSQNGDPFSKEAGLKKIVKEGFILCLFNNNEYSEIKGDCKFKCGNWKIVKDNKSILFIDSVRSNDPL